MEAFRPGAANPKLTALSREMMDQGLGNPPGALCYDGHMRGLYRRAWTLNLPAGCSDGLHMTTTNTAPKASSTPDLRMSVVPVPRLIDPCLAGPAPEGWLRKRYELPGEVETYLLTVDIPHGQGDISTLAPLGWEITSLLASRAMHRARQSGQAVHCAAGCSICCQKYLVALAVPEVFAWMVAIRRLPSAQRGEILNHLARLNEQAIRDGLYDCFQKINPLDPSAQKAELGRWWKTHTVTCPLLKDDVCSLYHARPIACREFQSLSPPETCRTHSRKPLRPEVAMLSVLARTTMDLMDTRFQLVLLLDVLMWYRNQSGLRERVWQQEHMVETFMGRLRDELAESSDGSSSA